MNVIRVFTFHFISHFHNLFCVVDSLLPPSFCCVLCCQSKQTQRVPLTTCSVQNRRVCHWKITPFQIANLILKQFIVQLWTQRPSYPTQITEPSFHFCIHIQSGSPGIAFTQIVSFPSFVRVKLHSYYSAHIWLGKQSIAANCDSTGERQEPVSTEKYQE